MRCESIEKGERSMSEEEQLDLIEETLVYISEKKYPDSCSNNRKRQIRKKAEKFVVNDGELYYKNGKTGNVST